MVGFPLDLVKVRMQTNPLQYRTITSTIISIVSRDGMLGLYRGVTAPLLAIAPAYAVCFWGYDLAKQAIRDFDGGGNNPDYEFTISQLMVAGFISSLPYVAVMTPTERIKCLLQVQGDEAKGKAAAAPKYTSMSDCTYKVWKQGGIRSLYRGLGATGIRDGLGSFAWFGTYEFIKRELMAWQGKSDDELEPMAVMFAGGMAGVAWWTVGIPADVIKSQLQTNDKYRNTVHAYRRIVAEQGHAALFVGMRPALIQAFPANAACFLGMEVARKVFAFID